MFLQHNQTELNLTEVINIKMEYLEFVMLVRIECRITTVCSKKRENYVQIVAQFGERKLEQFGKSSMLRH